MTENLEVGGRWSRQQSALVLRGPVQRREFEGLNVDNLHAIVTYNQGDEDAPVRAAHRNLTNRPGQFQYGKARAALLPIGSGELEGGHKSVFQKRLKLSGAWWRVENADDMLKLRAARHNRDWDKFWTPVNWPA